MQLFLVLTLRYLEAVGMSFNKSIKKIIDDAEHNHNNSDVDLCDRA